MSRRAFTIVELLVVVAIIALLVSILIPTLTMARSIARTAQCAHNLRQIASAFRAWAGETGGQAGRPTYPFKERWPQVPYNVLPQRQVFWCPDDPGGKTMTVVPGLLYFLSAPSYGDVRIPFEDCKNCASRTGKDEDGPYTDFVFEESMGVQVQWCPNGPNEYPNCTHHDDKDGVFRFRVNEDGAMTMTLLNFHDNTRTVIMLNGQQLWPEGDGGSLHDYVGKTKIFSTFISSYAINSAVGQKYDVPPGTLTLVDYDEQYADLDYPDVIAQHLRRKSVARHLGRVNVLCADESVRRMGPTEANPKINPDLWWPTVRP